MEEQKLHTTLLECNNKLEVGLDVSTGNDCVHLSCKLNVLFIFIEYVRPNRSDLELFAIGSWFSYTVKPQPQ